MTLTRDGEEYDAEEEGECEQCGAEGPHLVWIGGEYRAIPLCADCRE